MKSRHVLTSDTWRLWVVKPQTALFRTSYTTVDMLLQQTHNLSSNWQAEIANGSRAVPTQRPNREIFSNLCPAPLREFMEVFWSLRKRSRSDHDLLQGCF